MSDIIADFLEREREKTPKTIVSENKENKVKGHGDSKMKELRTR